MDEDGKFKQMSTATRQGAFIYLHGRCKEGELERGAMAEAARLFSVTHKAMALFWREMNKKIEDSFLDVDDVIANTLFFENDRTNRGRRPLWDRNELRVAVSTVPMGQRTTFRTMSKAVNVPKSTLHYLMKNEGLFHRHTSALQPHLTDEHKLARFMYAFDEVYPVPNPDGEYRFKNMYDRVDVDEKWFYLTKKSESYILINPDNENNENDQLGESHVYRAVKDSSKIKMVMFLCAQARPRWDNNANQMWDGKIGIWPIGEYKPATRTSVNRPAGTPVWKNQKVNKDKYRELLLEKVIPAIKDKWPRQSWNDNTVVIRIQQDGASAHISPDDEAFNAGLVDLQVHNKILLYTQPARSPDTNINDLGFFLLYRPATRGCLTSRMMKVGSSSMSH